MFRTTVLHCDDRLDKSYIDMLQCNNKIESPRQKNVSAQEQKLHKNFNLIYRQKLEFMLNVSAAESMGLRLHKEINK